VYIVLQDVVKLLLDIGFMIPLNYTPEYVLFFCSFGRVALIIPATSAMPDQMLMLLLYHRLDNPFKNKVFHLCSDSALQLLFLYLY